MYRIRLWFIITIALLLFGACSPDREHILTVTMSLSEEEWKVLRTQVFPQFETAHNVKIKSYQIEAGKLTTKLEALQRAGKSEIDVFAQDNMSLAPLVQKDLVLDLTPYEKNIPATVLPHLAASGRFNKSLLFMPFRPNVQIVYYNADVFEERGLNPPRTWNALLKIARRLYEKDGIGRVVLKGYGGNPTATQLYEFILQAGGEPYHFNDKGCIKAFSFLQRLAPYLSPETKRAKWDTTNDILARREAYLAQNWPFGIMVLIKKYSLAAFKTYSGWRGPHGEIHIIGGDVFGIPKNTAHKELALQFIAFMQSRRVQELLVTKLGWPSIRTDAYGEVEKWLKPHFDSVQQALRRGVFRKQVTWWPLYTKYVNAAFQDIVFNGAPVEETLNKYKNELERAKTALHNTRQ